LCPDPLEKQRPIDKKTARDKLKLPINAKIIGCVGSIDKRKGADSLVKSFLESQPKSDELLLLAGRQGKDVRNLIQEQKRKKTKGIHSIICIDRFVTQEEFFLSIAAIDVVAVVHPKQIGSSGSLIQSVASGKPVLGSDFGWIGYMMNKYELGFTCNTSDPKELIKGIKWALSNPSLNRARAKIFVENNSVENFKKKIVQDS
jgi:glycosyltransferase involved in cell wall biosynthesis